jgi:predicted butyrate kinase (DUF1464 family)
MKGRGENKMAKEKMVTRFISVLVDNECNKLYLSGRGMYPRFCKKLPDYLKNKDSFSAKIKIPEKYAEGNDAGV